MRAYKYIASKGSGKEMVVIVAAETRTKADIQIRKILPRSVQREFVEIIPYAELQAMGGRI